MRLLRQWGSFVAGFAVMVSLLGIAGNWLYRTYVPGWRRVEIDWSDAQSKADFLGSSVRNAEYVVLGDSVALRGIDAGCFEESLGPCVNLGLSGADIASYYSTVDVLRRLGANTGSQSALVIVYQDMFAPWTLRHVTASQRLATTFEGMLHLLQYNAAPMKVATKRWLYNLLDATFYRLYPRPIQVSALRQAFLGQLPNPNEDPQLFDVSSSGSCDCDAELLPYHRHSWWVENRRCASGSEPSSPNRPASEGYRYHRLNEPIGIPNDYPYRGLADVLKYLSGEFRRVWLVVFPDKYGYLDLDEFNSAMATASDRGGTSLILLTDLDVASLFYDEHHALPEGMEFLTQTILERMREAAPSSS